MSETRQLLTDMADGLFQDLSQAHFADSWPRLEGAGFTSLRISEAQGGFGGDWGDAYAVIRLAGRHALNAPIGDSLIAHALLVDAGIAPPEGLVTFAAPGQRVPHGRHAAAIVTVADGQLALHAAVDCQWSLGLSPAGEPFDALAAAGPPLATAASGADLLALGAFARVALTAGALEAAFSLTLDHVNSRVQFGKPLARFQAVQQALAELSVEVAAVDASGQALASAMELGEAAFEAAAAKLRANIAIERAVPIAHRLHGAIGFTLDYALQRHTRRLMGWRSAFGTDACLAEQLGRTVVALGGEGLWAELTARTDRNAA